VAQARILIVEDQVVTAENIRDQLGRLGYDVPAIATFGEEALEMAIETQPDLVLMDIQLAGEMDGTDAARQIRANLNIPVVFLTAYADDETLDRAKGSEPYGYVLKPFRIVDLQSTIEVALYKHQMEGKLKESEEKLRAILESAPTAVVITDNKGRIVLVNARAETMFGYPREELLGRAVEILLPVRFRSVHETHHAGFLAEPRTRPMGTNLDLTARHKDGTDFPVEIGLGYTEAQDGPVVISFVTDVSSRRLAEEALRVKDSALASSINATAMADLEGNLTYVNASFLKMWGYSHEQEVLGQSVLGFWQDEAQAAEVVTALFDKGSWVGELVGRKENGDIFDAQLSASIVFDDSGNPVCLLASFLDVTDRKQVEAQIESLARFPSENPTPVLRISHDGVVVYANRASASLLKFWNCELDAPVPGEWRRFVADVFASGLPQEAEVEWDDQTLSLTFAPVKEAGYLNVYGVDITERKRTEAEMRKLSRAIEQSPSSVVITDTSGDIEYANPKFTELTGYRLEEVIGQNPRILKSGEQSAEFYTKLWESIAVGEEWHGEFSNQKKSGEIYWESALISPVRNSEGEVTHFLKVAEDITARRLAEEALRQRTEELQARNEELDAFAHTVAHDLKNPLNLVIGFAELLHEDFQSLETEDLGDYLGYIARNGRKMSNIVDELLLLAAVRKSDVGVEPMDMAWVVREALGRLDDMIEGAQAEIVRPSDWPVAQGYGPWVEEVWVNYLSNAIKYGGQPPRVELGADAQGSMIRFWVRDNGPGLTQEEQDKLFAPFTRLAQIRAEGHGLGLSIVRRIVEKLGGQAAVESGGVPGMGSTFSFTLPTKAKEG